MPSLPRAAGKRKLPAEILRKEKKSKQLLLLFLFIFKRVFLSVAHTGSKRFSSLHQLRSRDHSDVLPPMCQANKLAFYLDFIFFEAGSGYTVHTVLEITELPRLALYM